MFTLRLVPNERFIMFNAGTLPVPTDVPIMAGQIVRYVRVRGHIPLSQHIVMEQVELVELEIVEWMTTGFSTPTLGFIVGPKERAALAGVAQFRRSPYF